jgi:hypothetical protein
VNKSEIVEWAKSPTNLSRDGYWGRQIADELRSNGWRMVNGNRDYCSKASFEVNLQKEGREVNIVEASFLGSFTQVHVRNQLG